MLTMTRIAENQAAVDKMYQDHLDSLRMSGLPFDEADVRAAWADARGDLDPSLIPGQ